MRHGFHIAPTCVAGLLLVGCTVAIPDADHFPEARDVQTEDVAKDAPDVVGKDAKVDAADAKDGAGADAHDATSDVSDVGADVGEVAESDEIASDAVAEVADTTATAQDAMGDDADAVDPDASDAADIGPGCTPSQCDDGNPCTSDGCDLAAQCTHTDLASSACPDDGLPCTGDECINGVCAHTTLLPDWCIVAGICYAGGAFTADGCAQCQPALTPVGWTALPDSNTCTDGTVCTVGDHCLAGACLPGSVTSCDDGNACTADACDPTTGCGHINLEDGSGCPAVGVCKLPGYCAAGVCESSPKLWTTSLDGGAGGDDRFNAVATTPAGEIIAVGARAGATGWQEGWAVHLNTASDLVENLPLLVDPAGNAHYSSVAVAPDGSMALGGATSTDAVVQLIHANGVPQQVQPFAPWGAGDVTTLEAQDTGWLALDAQGHIARLKDTGATVWTATAAGYGVSVLRGIVGLADGGAIAVGSCVGLGNQAATALGIRISATGNVLWQRTFGDSGSAFSAVTVAADGTVFVTGSRPKGSEAQLWFGHLTSDGAWLGGTTWPLGALSAVSGGVSASNGTWRLVGSDAAHVWLGAFDWQGNALWQKTHEVGTARGLALSAGGGALIVGETPAPADGLVLRVDPWGEGDCAVSQLCSNLTLSACNDGEACTHDVCGGGTCSHTPMDAVPCQDSDACSVADACSLGQCAGAPGLFDSTVASVTAYAAIAGCADGGALLVDSANAVIRLTASGVPAWSHSLSGGTISAVAVWPNGWTVTLQGVAGGTLRRFSDLGDLVAGPVEVDGATGGNATALAVLQDDSVVVVGTAAVGGPNQAAFVERFDAIWTGVTTSLPGSFGFSQGLAVAAAKSGGCGVLTVEGAVAKIHRLDADLQETWSKPLSVSADSVLAAMPDDGWLVAGHGPKGLALERYGPDGAFEFAVQWPIAGLTEVRALTVLADGTSAVAIARLVAGVAQGGIARSGPLGGLLSITWGADGSHLADVATAEWPGGVWAVGNRPGGGWLLRMDSHGGASCDTSGSCVLQSLVCDDGNPCTNDGCAAGKCTIGAPGTPGLCLDGGVCTAEGACPLQGTCGDGKCNVGESSVSCPGDCDASCDGKTCDDGDPCTVDYCQAGNCAIGGAAEGTACALGKSCALGQCAVPGCGDGACESGETATSCPVDCPACGDGVCGAGENNHLCPADCAKPTSGCKNMCGWKSQKPGGGVCWCDVNCTPGPFGDCCDDKPTFCP